ILETLALVLATDRIGRNIGGGRDLLIAAGNVFIFTFALGILTMAGEYRHKTASGTYLVTPGRTRVLIGKFIAAAVGGIGVALVSMVAVFAFGVPLMVGMHKHITLDLQTLN